MREREAAEEAGGVDLGEEVDLEEQPVLGALDGADFLDGVDAAGGGLDVVVEALHPGVEVAVVLAELALAARVGADGLADALQVALEQEVELEALLAAELGAHADAVEEADLVLELLVEVAGGGLAGEST